MPAESGPGSELDCDVGLVGIVRDSDGSVSLSLLPDVLLPFRLSESVLLASVGTVAEPDGLDAVLDPPCLAVSSILPTM